MSGKYVTEGEIKHYKIKNMTEYAKMIAMIVFVFAEIAFVYLFLDNKGMLPQAFTSSKACLVINVDQEIKTDYINRLIEDTEKILTEHKKEAKAILVVMNSPGGSPSASEEFASYLKDLQTRGIDVTMYVDSIAASGGYYIASAIKPIIANKNAIIGSIGVIMPHYSLEGLAKKVGITEDYIAAGKFKKPISVFKDMDSENKKYLKEHLLSPAYKNFVSDVAKNRGLDYSAVERVAQGKVYIANMQKIRGILVDSISHLYKVKADLKEKYGEDLDFFEVNKLHPDSNLFAAKLDLNLKDGSLEIR